MENETQPETATAFRITGTLLGAKSTLLASHAGSSARGEVALLTLDGEGLLRLEVRTRFDGDATPIEEYHRRLLTWSVLKSPAQLDVARLRAALTAGGALYELMRRVAEGHDEAWDGHNVVGTLTDDAEEASAELQEAFEDEAFASDVVVLDADAWFDDFATVDIRKDSTDEELEELASAGEDHAAANGIVLLNTVDLLISHRDCLRKRCRDDE
jgi:hypothetical protein